MTIKVPIKLAHPSAKVPTYANHDDAGVDLYATKGQLIQPGERALIPTGIHVAIPTGYEGLVRPKSGLALKHGISIVNTPGTIDAGYRGEIGVIVINHGEESYQIEAGKKIAQMVFNKIEKADFVQVEELDDTTRGAGGFGSTGLH